MKIYELEINGKSYKVSVEAEPGHKFRVRVNDEEVWVELKSVQRERAVIETAEPPSVVRRQVSIDTTKAGELVIRAPIPGEVRKILVKPEERVKQGDILLVIEAMKMENNIVSSAGGVVKEVMVQEGEVVKYNQPLISLKVIEK